MSELPKYSVMLKAKLHKATVTDVALEYEGSMNIDQDLMDRVRILPYEKILVANLRNGERFETYAIPGERGSGTICLNGATAHKGAVGDHVIIFTFTLVPDDHLGAHRPLIQILDEKNRPLGGLKEV